MAEASKPKLHCSSIVHSWRARLVLSFMFPLLWELLCGIDHNTKKRIARNLRAWSHSLFEVFITMSIILSNWDRVKKRCSPKHMMGESRWHTLANQKNTTEQSCTLEEPDTFLVLCFLSYGSCSVAKTIKPKKLIARNVKAWSHSLFEVFISMSRIFSN